MQSIKHASILIFYLFASLFSCVQAANGVSGWDRVSMQGSIIEPACAIALDSRDQVIVMRAVTSGDHINNAHMHSKPFSVSLINCALDDTADIEWKHFQVTFDGDREGTLFGIRGEASGVGLQISDGLRNIVLPGKALPSVNIKSGNKQLNYVLKLVANNQELKPGKYSSSIHFKLNYL